MPNLKPCFELYIVDNGFVIHHKLPAEDGSSWFNAETNVYEHIHARAAVDDLWQFIRPYAKIPAYEGAMPAEIE